MCDVRCARLLKMRELKSNWEESALDVLLQDLSFEFRRHKSMADRAMAQLTDDEFFRRPGELVNPIALIVKHLAGNFLSRWTDFLTTDGEKPTRDRDGEFVLRQEDTRANLLGSWEIGWNSLFATINSLNDADLNRPVTIRGEQFSAQQALIRGLTHVAYHTGQILYLVRLLRPGAQWLTIAPGQSRGFPGQYRKT